MWALDKCSYTEGFVRIAGQMGGGLVAFPFFHYVSETLSLTPFGGPEFSEEADVEAFISEFVATFLLMWTIYIVSAPKKILKMMIWNRIRRAHSQSFGCLERFFYVLL